MCVGPKCQAPGQTSVRCMTIYMKLQPSIYMRVSVWPLKRLPQSVFHDRPGTPPLLFVKGAKGNHLLRPGSFADVQTTAHTVTRRGTGRVKMAAVNRSPPWPPTPDEVGERRLLQDPSIRNDAGPVAPYRALPDAVQSRASQPCPR